jgi:hypothetical protein
MHHAGKSSNHWLAAAVLPIILAGMPMGQQKLNAPQCTSVSISFSLKAGESFQQEISNLMFDVRADTSSEEPNGWTFSIYGASGDDLIAPVNIPLRFNPSQILGPGYGLSARESLQTSRELPFLLGNSDYELVAPLWRDALWPYSAPDPDHAADKYTSTIARLPLGLIKLKPLKVDISPDDVIRSASFEASFIIPSGFHLDPSLKRHSSPCPRPFK